MKWKQWLTPSAYPTRLAEVGRTDDRKHFHYVVPTFINQMYAARQDVKLSNLKKKLKEMEKKSEDRYCAGRRDPEVWGSAAARRKGRPSSRSNY